jgi:hypothetical protein
MQMKKHIFQFLEEQQSMNESNASIMINNILTLLKSGQPKEKIESAIKGLYNRQDAEIQTQLRQRFKNSNINHLFPQPTTKLTEGESFMSNKQTKLDMFLEGIESVEVSKKPKFHSIHRLYEEVDGQKEQKEKAEKDEKEKEEKDCEEVDENAEDFKLVGEGEDEEEGDEEEGDEHEAGESDGEEEAEKEAGDDDEAGGEDEEPESDEDDKESDDEDGMKEGVGEALRGDVLDKDTYIELLKSLAAGVGSAKDLVAKVSQALTSGSESPELKAIKLAAMKRRSENAKASAAARGVLGAKSEESDADEMAEGSQGYAAGLKGVRKDAGAKSLKSGSNKIPTPKVAITGDKKLLKKPTTLKGDTYPKSSVAGAARPGAPKVKKS